MVSSGSRYSLHDDDESEIDETDEHAPLQDGEEEPPWWNIFRMVPIEEESGSAVEHPFYEASIKVLKVVVYFLTFGIVLGGCMVAKGTMLFMTAQLKMDKKLSYCDKNSGLGRSWSVEIPEIEKVAWTWCLFLAFTVPEVGTFVRSARLCFFKTLKRPTLAELATVAALESLHTVGVAILVYAALPELDSVRALMLTNCVCLVPGLLGMISRHPEEPHRVLKLSMDAVALLLQVTGCIVWPVIEAGRGNYTAAWAIPSALVLTSVGWWENFVTEKRPVERRKKGEEFTIFESRPEGDEESGETGFAVGFLTFFQNLKWRLNKTRYVTYFFVSVWKVAVFFGMMVLLSYFRLEDLQGKFACKICIQPFSFSLPVSLAVPCSLSLLLLFCGMRADDACCFNDSIPSYLFFECPSGDYIDSFMTEDMVWIWAMWLLSQVWITTHIWFPTSFRLAPTEKLFVTPMYNALLIDQSLALNRKRDEQLGLVGEKYLQIVDKDYYHFKTHIFFDDAFEISDDETEEMQVVNRWVKQLCHCIEEACSNVHGVALALPPPVKTPTPYGGRLIYTLPGKTQIVVHLKDKSLIRHRKRWSQVMYMYYLLGFNLMEQPIDPERKEVIAENTYLLALDGDIDFLPDAVKLLVDLMKKNANLGAACGRIHPVGTGPMVWYQLFEYAIGHWFQKATEHMIGCVLCSPGCFSLFRARALMDDNVMKTYTTPASEARHYVQYDQGEDRWLCTLLLQRGYRVEYCAASDAYTHAPEGFNEFYNQRRRWVPSTMANILDLLASHSRTVKVNDNISTLYIMYQVMLMVGTVLGPGTIFLMLVGSFNAAFGISNWDSLIYNSIPVFIFMFACMTMSSKIQLMIAQLLTAVYMVVMVIVIIGMALQFAEEGLESPSAIFFMATMGSFVATGEWQSLLHPLEFYCLPALVVYYITVPSMYFLLIVYSFTNMNNVTWGTREVAVKTRKSKEASEITLNEQEAEKKALEAAKKQPGGIMGFLSQFNSGAKEEEGSVDFSLGNVFRCMCCTYPKANDEREQLKRIADSIDNINKRMDSIEGGGLGRRRTTSRSSVRSAMSAIKESAGDETEGDTSDDLSAAESEEKIVTKKRDLLRNPLWIEDEMFADKGNVELLSTKEIDFWNDLIKAYLYPLIEDKAEKRVTTTLYPYLRPGSPPNSKSLRSKVCLFFFMINLVFVVAIFNLQLHQDELHLNWPFGAMHEITYSEDASGRSIKIAITYLQLEPIGFIFVLFFAVILLIQFTAMLFHRFGTISQILSLVTLNWCSSKKEQSSTDLLMKEGIKMVTQMQKASVRQASVSSGEGGGRQLDRRKTISRLADEKRKSRKITFSLDDNFKQTLEDLDEVGEAAGGRLTSANLRMSMNKRRATIKAIQDRRKSVAEHRRMSRMNSMSGAAMRSHVSTPSTSSQQYPLAPYTRTSHDGGYDNGVFQDSGEDSDYDRPQRA
ncbi:Chitin synthase chs-2 [Amphibalanus amphitrite]|uniref:chitin synthase n=1 Tax=Amphibalanus amphitrite TaxID=1232801 RepID=A0A6A4W271_AMPAM|nr:Chitin synthase chs-2 [Amphibalanus amphitrite]